MKRTALVICSILLILVSLFGLVAAGNYIKDAAGEYVHSASGDLQFAALIVLAVAAVLFAVVAIVNAKKKAKAPVETDEDIYEKA